MKKLFLIIPIGIVSYLFGRGVQMAFDKNYYEGWF